MSAKPTVFSWATSTSFAGGPLVGKPTKVYPSSGKAAEGFHPGELPPAQNFNALFGRLGLWTQYLSDGDLTGNHTITGTFGVTGNTTLTGTLGVTSTAAVDGLITANAGLLVPTGQNITLAGTADLKHGTRTIGLDIAAGRAIGSSNVDYQGTALTWTGAGTWDIGIQLPAGTRITGCTVYYSRDSGGTLTFRIGERSTDGSTSFVVSKDISAGAGAGNTALETSPTAGALPYTLLTGKSYYFSASAGNTDDVTSIELTYDRQ